MQKVLDWPFCNFVTMCQAAKFKVQWCTTKNKSCLSGQNWNKDVFCALMEWRMKILVVAKSFAPPSSKIIKLWQLHSDLSWDSYITYRNIIVSKYCIILINSSPLRDCDMHDEIFISSPWLEGCDIGKISSDLALCPAILAELWIEFAAVVCHQSKN